MRKHILLRRHALFLKMSDLSPQGFRRRSKPFLFSTALSYLLFRLLQGLFQFQLSPFQSLDFLPDLLLLFRSQFLSESIQPFPFGVPLRLLPCLQNPGLQKLLPDLHKPDFPPGNALLQFLFFHKLCLVFRKSPPDLLGFCRQDFSYFLRPLPDFPGIFFFPAQRDKFLLKASEKLTFLFLLLSPGRSKLLPLFLQQALLLFESSFPLFYERFQLLLPGQRFSDLFCLLLQIFLLLLGLFLLLLNLSF